MPTPTLTPTSTLHKLFTSYFAKASRHPKAVAITVRPPIFAQRMRHCKDLAPTWPLVNDYKCGAITSEQYKLRYLDIIKKRGVTPEIVLACLPEGAVLLCYETPGEFCHRHLAAEWLMQVPGVIVEELP